ncbi:AraC-like DNA-binding protein [Kibdelosporangium banguiense]|uniref:AraC-like DNA-binding protein n=1 Tax=Kibdelosporangium banguiense TaxID=1365924 RepID=A0ABS4U3X3_9PSEU|nr:AraC family transcriptional regulator [Kibdelosporangium banguiense]MBP2330890.1 AraC-like DNA-binding protein [Kibdelosporangium banguiense]
MKPWDIRTACERTGDEQTLTRLPSTSTSLIFAVLPEGVTRLLVMGPRTHAAYFPRKDSLLTVNAQFRPGWARTFTGVPVSELTDQVVPLGDLWGKEGDRLHDALIADPANAVGLIENALSERVTEDPSSALVHEATRWLSQERLPETARRLHVSERHLRTLFTGAVGVSPKRFVQLNRVRKVLSQVGTQKGAQLAIGSGYYDQSHMTAEFRATMGVPLSRYLAGDLPADSVC